MQDNKKVASITIVFRQGFLSWMVLATKKKVQFQNARMVKEQEAEFSRDFKLAVIRFYARCMLQFCFQVCNISPTSQLNSLLSPCHLQNLARNGNYSFLSVEPVLETLSYLISTKYHLFSTKKHNKLKNPQSHHNSWAIPKFVK